ELDGALGLQPGSIASDLASGMVCHLHIACCEPEQVGLRDSPVGSDRVALNPLQDTGGLEEKSSKSVSCALHRPERRFPGGHVLPGLLFASEAWSLTLFSSLPALLPFTAPMLPISPGKFFAPASSPSPQTYNSALFSYKVFLSLLSVKSLKSMVLPQFSFFTYTTAFNVINGNASYNRRPYESILLGAGVIASSTFLGLLPRLFQVRYSLNNILVKKVLPVIIFAQVSAMNVVASRGFEPVRGIEVMDKEGNVMGYSRKAGTKAVRDTAATRAVLFGTSAFIPEVFSYFFKRTQFFMQYPRSLWTFKLSCTILVMGLMVPVSLSIFPQIGRVSDPHSTFSQKNNIFFPML
ncbi:hypothetical protein MC885_001346, partial [Smutsia gigantea]